VALQSIWYYTDLNPEIVKTIETDLKDKFDDEMKDSQIDSGAVNKEKRNSHNAWVPTTHWLGGFMWHYIQRANRENFLYDLTAVDGEAMQYTRYSEGQFYGWHNDSDLPGHYKPISSNTNNLEEMIGDYLHTNTEYIRKLSFVLQLSNPDDYEGGNLQLMDEEGASYIAPRQQGTVILFDSRTQHRVQKVRSGVRKSIVGWVVGPRWK
jgi:PKHD-type hydroxylase